MEPFQRNGKWAARDWDSLVDIAGPDFMSIWNTEKFQSLARINAIGNLNRIAAGKNCAFAGELQVIHTDALGRYNGLDAYDMTQLLEEQSKYSPTRDPTALAWNAITELYHEARDKVPCATVPMKPCSPPVTARASTPGSAERYTDTGG